MQPQLKIDVAFTFNMGANGPCTEMSGYRVQHNVRRKSCVFLDVCHLNVQYNKRLSTGS